MGNCRQLSNDSFQVKGASLLDLFETAGLCMLNLEYDTSLVGFERELEVTASGPDLEMLLESWLSRLARARDELGIVVGDVIVVEVGKPPVQRYGDTSLACRAAARGRSIGDWFHTPSRALESVQPGSIRVDQGKRTFAATVSLKWA